MKKKRPRIEDENFQLFIYAIWWQGFYITRKPNLGWFQKYNLLLDKNRELKNFHLQFLLFLSLYYHFLDLKMLGFELTLTLYSPNKNLYFSLELSFIFSKFQCDGFSNRWIYFKFNFWCYLRYTGTKGIIIIWFVVLLFS